VHENDSYRGWLDAAGVDTFRFGPIGDPDALRASGRYRVVTPEECIELAREVDRIELTPLIAGLSPKLGWEGLELFAAKVLPALGRP
jgi:hypothetical protein